jgi:glycosyl transferase family 25
MLKCEMKAYYINLDRNPERRDHLLAQWGSAGGRIERISAVDASLMSESQLRTFTEARPRKRWLAGQIGCFLSHFEAWSRISAGDDDLAAIFEDDLHINGELHRLLENSEWAPADADIIRLESAKQSVRILNKRALANGRTIGRLGSGVGGSGAYIIRRDTAQCLLNTPPRWHKPTDFFLFDSFSSPIARALTTYQVSPAPCAQDKFLSDTTRRVGFASDIENQKSTSLRRQAVATVAITIAKPVWRLLANKSLIRFG